MEHRFGYHGGGLAQRERLCTEPEVKGATYETIYHVTFEMLPDGNARCLKCGECFLDTPKNASLR